MAPIYESDADRSVPILKQEEISVNDILFLEDAGLMTSFDKGIHKEIHEEHLCLRNLMITICMVALLIDLWPLALRPMMMSFFSWANGCGYLSLWRMNE